MKIELKSFSLCALILSVIFVPSSVKAWDVSAVGAINYATPNITALGIGGSTAGFSPGGGALLGFELGSIISAELGALLLPRNYGSSGGSISLIENRLQIPLVLRFDIPVLQIVAGGYYSHGIGNVTLNGTALSYSAAAVSSSDFGFLAGVGKVISLGPNLGLLIRGQFTLGVPNASTTPLVSIYYRDLQLLAGLNLKI